MANEPTEPKNPETPPSSKKEEMRKKIPGFPKTKFMVPHIPFPSNPTTGQPVKKPGAGPHKEGEAGTPA